MTFSVLDTNNDSVQSHRKVVIANWKMHGSLQENAALISAYLHGLKAMANEVQVVVCVPYPYLAQMQQLLAGTSVQWGAQNIAKYERGAYTGEVGAQMLRDFGATHVIVGHSERSTAYCESDENVAEKFMVAKRNGLTPILCVGETLLEREAGVMERVVGRQLETIVRMFGGAAFSNTIVSYEPIWAIGTGLAATAEQVVAMHSFIRQTVAEADARAAQHLKILYGGSVNSQNALQLLQEERIDGALVGRASLDADAFVKICHAARLL